MTNVFNTGTWLDGISSSELVPYTLHGQHGEEGVWKYVFDNIEHKRKYCVEFGCSNPTSKRSGSTTRWLIESCKWNGLLMDGNPRYCTRDAREFGVQQEWITPANIVSLFQKHNVPHDLDLLSIDIDYNDWWVLRSIFDSKLYSPSVICFEFNTCIDPSLAITVERCDDMHKDNTVYFGASLRAFNNLARKHGYSLVHVFTTAVTCCSGVTETIPGCNGVLCRNDLLPCEVDVDPSVFRPTAYVPNRKEKDRLHRAWVDVTMVP